MSEHLLEREVRPGTIREHLSLTLTVLTNSRSFKACSIKLGSGHDSGELRLLIGGSLGGGGFLHAPVFSFGAGRSAFGRTGCLRLSCSVTRNLKKGVGCKVAGHRSRLSMASVRNGCSWQP